MARRPSLVFKPKLPARIIRRFASRRLSSTKSCTTPLSSNDDDEFIELYNPGTNALDVGNWRLEDAVKFTIPPGTSIPAKSYFVIARNATKLRTIYPTLSTANCLGDWQGALRNSGERIALSVPDTIVSTNGGGIASTNTIHIVVDEVTYKDGGRWGRWSTAAEAASSCVTGAAITDCRQVGLTAMKPRRASGLTSRRRLGLRMVIPAPSRTHFNCTSP